MVYCLTCLPCLTCLHVPDSLKRFSSLNGDDVSALSLSRKLRSFMAFSLIFLSRWWNLSGHFQRLFTHGLKQSREAQAPQHGPQILTSKKKGLPLAPPCLSHLDSTCFYAGTEAFQLSGMQTRAPSGSLPFVRSQLSWCWLERVRVPPHREFFVWALCQMEPASRGQCEVCLRCRSDGNTAVPKVANKTCKSFFFYSKRDIFMTFCFLNWFYKDIFWSKSTQ